MIDRRQILVGSASALVVFHIAPASVGVGIAKPKLLASHWEPTRRFTVGDELGYVVDSFMRSRTLLFTVVVTGMSEERGGWNFEMESVGQPGALFPNGAPYNSYTHEAAKRLWHLFRFGPR
jgi:hypothetical protein